MNTMGFIDSVGRDLRFALRGLARRPAFTLAAVRANTDVEGCCYRHRAIRWTRVQHEILDRIAALPGVASAGFVDGLPIWSSGALNNNGFAVEGRALEPQDQRPQAHCKFISPGYFETMGTRLIAGRSLTWSDIEAGGRVVVVSEEFARQLATEPAAALGLRIRFATYDQDACAK